jgi:hypothetical protein
MKTSNVLGIFLSKDEKSNILNENASGSSNATSGASRHHCSYQVRLDSTLLYILEFYICFLLHISSHGKGRKGMHGWLFSFFIFTLNQ